MIFLLKVTTGTDMRKSMKGYNLDFLNTMLGLSSAIVIVAYINYLTPFTGNRGAAGYTQSVLFKRFCYCGSDALPADHICTEKIRVSYRDPV